MAVNSSEELVEYICNKCFLSLWSYPNPIGKNGKELCDVLVVCDPHVIVISVKEVVFQKDKEFEVAAARWERKAIDSSVGQLDGALRWLEDATNVIDKNGLQGIPLPTRERRKTHALAIALGSKDSLPVSSGLMGRGFVHVLTEDALRFSLRELDTVTDFTNFLTAVEELTAQGSRLLVQGSHADLTAFYLSNGKAFPKNQNAIVVTSGFWDHYSKRPERLRKLEEDKISYVWDRLVEMLIQDVTVMQHLSGTELLMPELALRVMARESRFSRRSLAECFTDFYEKAKAGEISARRFLAESGHVYMFLFRRHSEDRMSLVPELEGRTFLARGFHPEAKGAVGILIEHNIPDRTESFILYLIDDPDWSDKDQADWEAIRKETGAWENPVITEKTYQEFPLD